MQIYWCWGMLFMQHVYLLSYDTPPIYIIWSCQNWKGGGLCYVNIAMAWHRVGSCGGIILLESSWMDEIGYILYMSQMISTAIVIFAFFFKMSRRGMLSSLPLVFACEQKSELAPPPTWSSITITHQCI